MDVTSAVLLAVLALAFSYFVWTDFRDYPRFKAAKETRERQRFYARWLLIAFALFVPGSLICLALIGQLPALLHQPPPFAALAARLNITEGLSEGFLIGAGASALMGLAAATFVAARSGAKQPVVGDIEALMPKSRAEYGWVTLMSFNAGIGEELMFRLVLPLLLFNVTGDVLVAFVAATIVFGLVRAYQGVIGIAATMLVGGVMAALYLVSGSLLWPIVLHVLIDLRGLVVQPALTNYFKRAAAS